MEWLPSPLARLALPLFAALGLSSRAVAQIPFTPAAPASAGENVPAPGPSSPVAEAGAPAALPAAPAAPAPSIAPLPPAAAQPAPAKADQLKEPPVTAVEAASDDDAALDEEDSSTEGPRRTWYGWQTLTADGISTLLFITGASLAGRGDETGETLAWASLAGYEFAPGVVHFVHENPGRGFASFGIRLGLPLAGAFVGAAAASGCSGYECEAGGAGAGFLLGMGGAIAIDAAVLAYDYPQPSRRAARVLPVVSVAPGRTFVGLAGEL
jgi:hypothetical protein